jgi:hypothetical protein
MNLKEKPGNMACFEPFLNRAAIFEVVSISERDLTLGKGVVVLLSVTV